MRTRKCQEEFIWDLVLIQLKKDANNHVNRDRGRGGGMGVEIKEVSRGDKPAQITYPQHLTEKWHLLYQ